MTTRPSDGHRQQWNAALLSGQYVRVRVHVRDQADALLVPKAALGFSQFGNYLYVVGKDGRAQQRPVTPGPALGDLVSVTDRTGGVSTMTYNGSHGLLTFTDPRGIQLACFCAVAAVILCGRTECRMLFRMYLPRITTDVRVG